MATLAVPNRAATETELFLANQSWACGIAEQALRRLPAHVDRAEMIAAAIHELAVCVERFRPDYREEGHAQPVSFAQFAYRRIYFACLMRARGRQYRESEHEQLTDHAGIVQPDTDEVIHATQVRRLLAAAIADTTDPTKTILRLHYFAEVPIYEVARRVGMSESHTSRLHTAGLAQVRKALHRRGVRSLRGLA